MRYSPVAMALALGFACVSSGVLAQKPDSQINPLSVSLARAGEAALAAKNYQGAIDRLESALAADPRNRRAYILLGDRKSVVWGKRVSLSLDPGGRRIIKKKK